MNVYRTLQAQSVDGASNYVREKTDAPLSGVEFTDEDKDNLSTVKNSAQIWLGLLFLYILWGFIQRETVTDELKKEVIKANVHNLFVIGLAAILFKNFFNILLTKLIKWNIPIVSKIAGGIVPIIRA